MRIVVLAGGISSERDVSILSGARVAAALRTKGHQVVCIDPYMGYEEPLDSIDRLFEENYDFLKTDKHIQKYCTGLSPELHDGKRLSCKQYAKQHGAPEKADGDPFKIICNKRIECIRTEKNRGTITPVFAAAATLLTQNHLTRSLAEPDYTLDQFKKDLERKTLYKETGEYLEYTPVVPV